MAKNREGKNVVKIKVFIIIAIAIVLGISCLFSTKIENLLGLNKDLKSNSATAEVVYAQDMIVNYIDVGQGDSTFIELPGGKSMLIDAGVESAGKTVCNYIQSRNYSTIDYLILTHSDSDHAGGMKRVFDTFEIKNVYRPFQIAKDKNSTGDLIDYTYEDLKYYATDKNIVTTATYRNFVKCAYTEFYTQGEESTIPCKVYVSYDGLKIEESGYTFEFFMPQKTSNESVSAHALMTEGYPVETVGTTDARRKNNASPVMLLEYKQESFVFTGDANKEIEEEFIETLSPEEKPRFEKVSVFQAGHHGSDTSNCTALLTMLDPTYVVVSVGAGNNYGHPTATFLKTVDSLTHRVNDYLLRTDLNQTIIFGVGNDGLVFTVGISTGNVVDKQVVHWYYIAIIIFVVAAIIVISIRVKSNGDVSKTSVKKGTKTAKKVVKRYFGD